MADYIKLNNSWVEIYKVYKKINDEWVEQTDINSSLSNNTVYICNSVQIDETIYVISGVDTYTGKTFNLQAILNNRIVPATWTITSGSQYATINQNGKVSIIEGTTNQSITVQAVYNGRTETKTITISYDNQLIIEGSDIITGTSGNVIARYNSTTITPTWSITSGDSYATISNDGTITIISSGEITIQAIYSTYTTTKTITLVYNAGSSTETTIDENGNVTTETTTTSIDPNTGETTVTTSSTTINDDGSSSTSESTTVTSAPDPETGAVTTEETVTVTNSDGTSSEIELTIIENQDGSTNSTSTTTNYDENGDVSGSTENETTNNADGSSSSSTINYNANGDPTDKVNENIDAIGNEKTQNIEYDSNGDEVVVGYVVDTTNNEDTGSLGFEGSSEDAINTGFVPFDINSSENGFDMVIYFRSSYDEQKDIAHGGDTNEQWTILDMTPDDSSNNWANNQGLIIRWQAGAKPKIYTQLRYNGGNKKENVAATTINGVSGYFKFGLRFYNGKLVFRNLLTNTNIVSVNNNAFTVDLSRVKVTVGSGWDAINQVQFRYSTMDLIDFQINKIHEWTDY